MLCHEAVSRTSWSAFTSGVAYRSACELRRMAVMTMAASARRLSEANASAQPFCRTAASTTSRSAWSLEDAYSSSSIASRTRER
eukprot:1476633-Prymnesium_polylepis.2